MDEMSIELDSPPEPPAQPLFLKQTSDVDQLVLEGLEHATDAPGLECAQVRVDLHLVRVPAQLVVEDGASLYRGQEEVVTFLDEVANGFSALCLVL